MRIPALDFTDVVLASEDIEEHDDHEDHNDHDHDGQDKIKLDEFLTKD